MTFTYGSLACVLLTASATYAETTFSFTNQWAGGGQGLFHITNDTSQPIQGWTLRFEWNAEITSAWNGTVQSHVGNQYKIVTDSCAEWMSFAKDGVVRSRLRSLPFF